MQTELFRIVGALGVLVLAYPTIVIYRLLQKHPYYCVALPLIAWAWGYAFVLLSGDTASFAFPSSIFSAIGMALAGFFLDGLLFSPNFVVLGIIALISMPVVGLMRSPNGKRISAATVLTGNVIACLWLIKYGKFIKL